MVSENPVRQDSYKVMNNSSDVHVNYGEISDFCEELLENFEFETASWDAPVFPSTDEAEIEDVFNFFLLGNSINYCFNDLDTGSKYSYDFIGTDWSGAFGMWAALMDEFQNNPEFLTSEYLVDLDLNDVEEIFNSSGSVDIPLIEERLECMRSVGRLIMDLNASFWTLFENGEVDLYGDNGVVEMLSEYSSYKDERTYQGENVRFDKRSQLVVSMLYGKVLGTKYEFKINDMDEFTVFADYGIPAGLASNDIIKYSDSLQSKITNQERIPENSSEEVEIRAATVVSGEEIQKCLSEQHNVESHMPILDYVLWCMRQEASTNEHLTETTAY